jgi:hypothetical protein
MAPATGRSGLWRCRARAKITHATQAGEIRPAGAIGAAIRLRLSAQNRALEMPLKRRDHVELAAENTRQVCRRLQERICVYAIGRRLLPTEAHAHGVEPATQALPQPVKRFQGEWRA